MKNKQRTILCVLMATVFLMPLMGNTASASDVTYYFNSYTGDGWEHTPDDMVDCSLITFAGTTDEDDFQWLDDNSYSGGNPGDITKVEIRAYGSYNQSQPIIILQPVFGGTVPGEEYEFYPPYHPNATWSDWFDITDDRYAPPEWNWVHIDGLDCNVTAQGSGFEAHCAKVELRVTYNL
jgi:hypothetical protein